MLVGYPRISACTSKRFSVVGLLDERSDAHLLRAMIARSNLLLLYVVCVLHSVKVCARLGGLEGRHPCRHVPVGAGITLGLSLG